MPRRCRAGRALGEAQCLVVARPVVPVRASALACVAVATLLGVAGCGAHGQPAALEACKSFSNATTGYMTPDQRDAALADAEKWAAKAVEKGQQWQFLLDQLKIYQQAVDSPGASTPPVRSRLQNSASAIQNSCELAARGY